jgi:tetratricopeptide (TPR) repeat protein
MMRGFFLAVCWLLGCSETSFSQTPEQLFSEGLQLEKSMKEMEAFTKFRQVVVYQPKNQAALYKCCELLCRIGARTEQKKTRDTYFQSATTYARLLLTYYPTSDETHVAMAMSLGRIALTKSGKEKISMVKDIRSYAENAIRLNPSNYKAWHILGKWHYEVSNLNFIEESAIKIFYGGLPDASFTKAIQAYEKAKALSVAFSLNYLELAKAYNKKGLDVKARESLQTLLALPITTEDDPRIHKEAKELLNRWD